MAFAGALSAQAEQSPRTAAAASRRTEAQIEFDRGVELVRKGRLEEAVPPLRKAASDPALSGEAHFILGVDYFESKEYGKAVAELRGLESSSHSERVLYMIEESNRRTGHVQQAQAAFHQLITQYPDSAWTHYLMGTAYEDQQQPEKAIQEYKEALQKDPAIPNADFAIGYLYWRQQNTTDAEEWLKRETQRGCHGLANFYLGEIARADRDPEKAEMQYRRALACDPSSAEAHLRLGMVLSDKKSYSAAINELKEAIRLQPNESSPHYHLAAVYTQVGRKADAEAEYNKVRQIQASKDNGTDITKASKQQ